MVLHTMQIFNNTFQRSQQTYIRMY